MHGSMRRREATNASRASTRRAAAEASRRPYPASAPLRRERTAASPCEAGVRGGRSGAVRPRPQQAPRCDSEDSSVSRIAIASGRSGSVLAGRAGELVAILEAHRVRALPAARSYMRRVVTEELGLDPNGLRIAEARRLSPLLRMLRKPSSSHDVWLRRSYSWSSTGTRHSLSVTSPRDLNPGRQLGATSTRRARSAVRPAGGLTRETSQSLRTGSLARRRRETPRSSESASRRARRW
jgi:hypothetical protein